MLKTVSILGVTVTNERKDTILEYLFNQLHKSDTKTFIITPNPEMVVYAHKHPSYRDALNEANIALPDGIGLFFAASYQKTPLHERITGVDFMEELCKASREPRFNRGKKPVSMGFLGGRDGVAELAAECLKNKYPWIDVVFTSEDIDESAISSWQLAFGNWHLATGEKDVKLTANYQMPTTIDILFVAYGVPKQEEWIHEHLHELPIKAAMGVGGAFDFLSGAVRRAPFVVRWAGLEWLYRLINQPWRWKRQLSLFTFLKLVLRSA